MHRPLTILSTALITAGAVILIDVGLTLVWKEPLSTVYGSIQQGDAEDSLSELEDEYPSPAALSALAGAKNFEERLRALADGFEREVEPGDGIARIEVPRIGLETVVVEGTDTASLRKGPGHYVETEYPGQQQTVAIAGHRTTYQAPFRDIDELEKGDEIVLELPYARLTYAVEGHDIVAPEEGQAVTRDVGYERLVLTACHPLYSAAERWVVFAELTGIELGEGAAPG